MIEPLATWLLSAMLAWCPPSIHRHTGATDAQTVARYQTIADDLASVALEPGLAPLYAGEFGRAKTALMVLAVASYESGGFRADVDTPEGTGDHGRAHCLAQLQMPYARGVVDRRSCFRNAVWAMRESFRACARLPQPERLALYASGSCSRGREASRTRMGRAMSFWTNLRYVP